MTNVTISGTFGQPLSGKDIDAAEKQLGVTLPLDYKQFLIAHNGGRPDPQMFPIEGDTADTHGYLNRLFGLNEHRVYNLIHVADTFRYRVPPELLPIGEDPGGNLICLTTSGPNKGKIYFWEMEEEADEGEPPTYENLYFVADSFTDLLDSLS